MSQLQNSGILKEGYMIKRSQNKKPYTRVNYKKRLFVLTEQLLIYYDGSIVSIHLLLYILIFMIIFLN